MSKLGFWEERCPALASFRRYEAASPKVVVLLSGGLDSTVLASVCSRAGLDMVALTVSYGQRHKVEVAAAQRVAAALGVQHHELLELPWLGSLSGSSLTGAMEEGEGPVASSCAYVPGRNLMMLSAALALAESVGSRVVLAGATMDDASAFPDCRAPFFEAVARAATLGTRLGQIEPVMVEAPFAHMRKADVVQLGSVLEAPMDLSHSCYSPVGDRPCGECGACDLRRRAFEDAGLPDHASTRMGQR